MIELMCAKRLFDRGLYEQYHILTSVAIQETYLDVKCKRGRGIEVYGEYWLLGADNVPENLTIISVHKPQTNEDILQTNSDLPQTNPDMPQKKCINKTKENKTEQNETEQNESLAAEAVKKFNSTAAQESSNGGDKAARRYRHIRAVQKNSRFRLAFGQE